MKLNISIRKKNARNFGNFFLAGVSIFLEYLAVDALCSYGGSFALGVEASSGSFSFSLLLSFNLENCDDDSEIVFLKLILYN